MNLGKYSYLAYMLIFTLTPILILWLKKFELLRKNIKIVGITAIIAIAYQFIVDPFAEAYKAWFFGEDKILGFWIFNFPIENILFFLLVSVAISSATLVFIDYEDTGKFRKILKVKK